MISDKIRATTIETTTTKIILDISIKNKTLIISKSTLMSLLKKNLYIYVDNKKRKEKKISSIFIIIQFS